MDEMNVNVKRKSQEAWVARQGVIRNQLCVSVLTLEKGMVDELIE